MRARLAGVLVTLALVVSACCHEPLPNAYGVGAATWTAVQHYMEEHR